MKLDRAPFAYLVVRNTMGSGAEVVGVFQTLVEVLAVCGAGGTEVDISAYFSGITAPVGVRAEEYSVPNPRSRAEALNFIRYRARKIAEDEAEYPGRPSFRRAMGALVCNCDDPEAKQVEDFQSNSPWAWRGDPNEDWWRGYTLAEPK